MSKFIVYVQEIHKQGIEIEADSQSEAIRKVIDGEGTYLENSLEYIRTLNPSKWIVSDGFFNALKK